VRPSKGHARQEDISSRGKRRGIDAFKRKGKSPQSEYQEAKEKGSAKERRGWKGRRGRKIGVFLFIKGGGRDEKGRRRW